VFRRELGKDNILCSVKKARCLRLFDVARVDMLSPVARGEAVRLMSHSRSTTRPSTAHTASSKTLLFVRPQATDSRPSSSLSHMAQSCASGAMSSVPSRTLLLSPSQRSVAVSEGLVPGRTSRRHSLHAHVWVPQDEASLDQLAAQLHDNMSRSGRPSTARSVAESLRSERERSRRRRSRMGMYVKRVDRADDSALPVCLNEQSYQPTSPHVRTRLGLPVEVSSRDKQRVSLSRWGLDAWQDAIRRTSAHSERLTSSIRLESLRRRLGPWDEQRRIERAVEDARHAARERGAGQRSAREREVEDRCRADAPKRRGSTPGKTEQLIIKTYTPGNTRLR